MFCLLFVCSFGQFSFDTCMVSYYPFNANAADESGFGNNGTVYGATLTEDRFGNPNSAYDFDGDDYITMLNPGPTADSSRTISFWALIETTLGVMDTGQTILAYGSTTLPNPGERYRIQVDRNCSGIGIEVEEAVYTKPTDVSVSEEWHHYVVVFDKDVSSQLVAGTKIYLDGNLITDMPCDSYSPSVPINTAQTHPLQLGKNTVTAYPRYFHGKLDDFRIYNCALGSTEIDSLFNEPNPTASIDEIDIGANVLIYPNPTNQVVSISIGETTITNVSILSVSGEIVKSIDSNFSEINVSDLTAGVYFVHVFNNETTIAMKKLVIE